MSEHPVTDHPKVFLSYSHDDEMHRGRILGLAERLRTDGFETMIDQYVEGTPPQGWQRWMLNQIEWADYVLLVCTETYYRRFRGRDAPQEGKGVDWEAAIITNELYDKKSVSSRFVPVLFDSGDSPYIPEPIRSFTFHVLVSEEAYAKLTDYLAGAAGIQPAELGPPPKRKRKTGTPARFGESTITKTTGNTTSRNIPDLSTLPAPGNTMGTDDTFYIERGEDRRANDAADRCGTIVIRGPRQFGKSSLLNHYISRCRGNGRTVATVNFGRFEQGVLQQYGDFLTALASDLARRLQVTQETGQLPTQARFCNFIEYVLLPSITGPVVFAFDNVDRIMPQAYAEDFFSMVRMWHDHRGDPSLAWHKLGIALVSSSEPVLFIKNGTRSPFNVGLPLTLSPFSGDDVAELNKRYGAPLLSTDCAKLHSLVGGHPFLVQDAYYKLFGPAPISFAQLCTQAAQDDGPFGQHLRAMLRNLQRTDGLLAALKRVIANGTVSQLEEFYRLEAAGLVRRVEERYAPTNQIYADFFRNLS